MDKKTSHLRGFIKYIENFAILETIPNYRFPDYTKYRSE